MKGYGGVELQFHSFFDLGTTLSCVVSVMYRPLYAQRMTACYHWIEGWLRPRAGQEAVVKRKIPSPRRESKPTTPIVHPID
jgi:hypothetical protein